MTVGASPQCSDLETGDLANPLGAFTAITTDRRRLCGTRPDGYLVCLDARGSTVLRPPAGMLSSLTSTSDGSDLCAVTGDGSIECWGTTRFSPNGDFGTGPFVSLDAGGWPCALKADGSVECPWAEAGLETPEGPFVTVQT